MESIPLDGLQPDHWQLAPACDVLPCQGHGGFHSLSVNGNYKNPGKEDAVQLAVKFGLKKDEAEEMFEKISETVNQPHP